MNAERAPPPDVEGRPVAVPNEARHTFIITRLKAATCFTEIVNGVPIPRTEAQIKERLAKEASIHGYIALDQQFIQVLNQEQNNEWSITIKAWPQDPEPWVFDKNNINGRQFFDSHGRMYVIV